MESFLISDVVHDPVLVLTACASMAVLLGHAAVHKIFNFEVFRFRVAVYGGGAHARWMAPLLVAIELALCVGLLGPWHGEAALGSALLMALYGACMARLVVAGRTVSCGCGAGELPVSWALVARNGVLTIWALAGAPAMSVTALAAADFLWVVAGVLVAVLLYVCLHQVLGHASHLAAWRRQQGGVQ